MQKPMPTQRSEFWQDLGLAIFLGVVAAMLLDSWWFA